MMRCGSRVPYVLVRVLGLGLQVRVELERAGASHAGVIRWAALSAVGLVLVLIGAVADPVSAAVDLVAGGPGRPRRRRHRRAEYGLGPEPGTPVGATRAVRDHRDR